MRATPALWGRRTAPFGVACQPPQSRWGCWHHLWGWPVSHPRWDRGWLAPLPQGGDYPFLLFFLFNFKSTIYKFCL